MVASCARSLDGVTIRRYWGIPVHCQGLPKTRHAPLAHDTTQIAGGAVQHAGLRVVGFRVVVLPGREAAMTRLCTNLSRTPFSLDVVARLYRFRWQIELCFKERKS